MGRSAISSESWFGKIAGFWLLQLTLCCVLALSEGVLVRNNKLNGYPSYLNETCDEGQECAVVGSTCTNISSGPTETGAIKMLCKCINTEATDTIFLEEESRCIPQQGINLTMAVCEDDDHCQNLPNTECRIPSGESTKRCTCKAGFGINKDGNLCTVNCKQIPYVDRAWFCENLLSGSTCSFDPSNSGDGRCICPLSAPITHNGICRDAMNITCWLASDVCPQLLVGTGDSFCIDNGQCVCQDPQGIRGSFVAHANGTVGCKASQIGSDCHDDSYCSPEIQGMRCRIGKCACLPYHRPNIVKSICVPAYGTCCKTPRECGSDVTEPYTLSCINGRICGFAESHNISNSFSAECRTVA